MRAEVGPGARSAEKDRDSKETCVSVNAIAALANNEYEYTAMSPYISRVAEIANGRSTSRRVNGRLGESIICVSSRRIVSVSLFPRTLLLSHLISVVHAHDASPFGVLASNVSLRATLRGVSSREEERMGSGDEESETGSTALPPGGT